MHWPPGNPHSSSVDDDAHFPDPAERPFDDHLKARFGHSAGTCPVCKGGR